MLLRQLYALSFWQGHQAYWQRRHFLSHSQLRTLIFPDRSSLPQAPVCHHPSQAPALPSLRRLLRADVFFPGSTPKSHFPHWKLFIEMMGQGKEVLQGSSRGAFLSISLFFPVHLGELFGTTALLQMTGFRADQKVATDDTELQVQIQEKPHSSWRRKRHKLKQTTALILGLQ